MISAAEARKKTTEIIEQGATAELQEISKEIEIAISKGMYQVNKIGILSSISIKVLTEMGYKIESGNYYNEYYYFIRW